MLSALKTPLLNAFFPPQCAHCGVLVESAGGLCADCWTDLHFIQPPFCARCGYPLAFEMGKGAQCGACHAFPPSFHAHRSSLIFDEASKKLVHDLKFYDRSLMVKTLGGWMASAAQDWFAESPAKPLLVPIPLHRYRLWKRKYNQAALLAQEVASRTGAPLALDALQRAKYRPPQAGLTRRQRLINLRGSFAINPRYRQRLKDQPVILVDDVMTTGATLNACAKLLKRAGCPRIYALTIARTVLED